MSAITEKGGGTFQGIKLLLCENPLPPIDEAIAAAYISELLALRPFVPWLGRGIEIGVGSGRFAAPLGVQVGIDPSPAMLARAAARGITIVEGTAEDLPFADAGFDHALNVW